MVEYKLQTQKTNLSNCTDVNSYGILAFEDNKLLHTISDISTDKSAVEELVEKFNTYDLSLCHLEQAVEDFLYNLKTD